MAKLQSANPVASYHKATKQRQIKRSKQQQQLARDERLATKNPVRLERRIEELKKLQSEAEATVTADPGASSSVSRLFGQRERTELEKLERDVKSIHRARKKAGTDELEGQAGNGDQRTTSRPDGTSQQTSLGKRSREGVGAERRDRTDHSNANFTPLGRSDRFGSQHRRRAGPASSDTDSDVADIPMPTDTEHMPPVPRRQRPAHARHSNQLPRRPSFAEGEKSDANPRGRPAAPSQKVYQSEAVVRDLKKEAIVFVPMAVRAKAATAASSNAAAEKSLEPTVEDDD